MGGKQFCRIKATLELLGYSDIDVKHIGKLYKSFVLPNGESLRCLGLRPIFPSYHGFEIQRNYLGKAVVVPFKFNFSHYSSTESYSSDLTQLNKCN